MQSMSIKAIILFTLNLLCYSMGFAEPPLKQNALEAYIYKHDYIPESKGYSYFPWIGLTQLGNQNSFYVTAPETLSSVTVGYFSDAGCFTQSSSKVLNGPVTLHAGTYRSTDQSNFALCSAYAGGCSGLFSDASGGTIKGISFSYLFGNGSSTQSPCMYNIAQTYEVLGDYRTPASPVACTSGNSCGYSQAYSSVTLGFPVVSTNINFSCMLSDANTSNMSCWGNGSSGQIGNGTNSSVNIPTSVTMPSGVSGLSAVSTNTNFSCAIADNGVNIGKIYCWLVGGSGLIGNGANSNVNIPTSVTMPSGVDSFSAVSTNGNFSCAIAGSGSNAGKVYCWGIGTSGQIGNGASINVNVPTLVTMPSNVDSFSAVLTNTNFSCAIAGSGANAGKVYCWGLGTNGRIGNGASSTVNVPTSVTMPSDVGSFSAVSTNDSFSCAIAGSGANAGKVYCWGLGTSGQIGNGANGTVNAPTLVTMPSGVAIFSAVSTNASFSCAIAGSGANAGKVYCWGDGSNGQIGNAENSVVNVPSLTV